MRDARFAQLVSPIDHVIYGADQVDILMPAPALSLQSGLTERCQMGTHLGLFETFDGGLAGLAYMDDILRCDLNFTEIPFFTKIMTKFLRI